ncbi:MAG: glycosyltransferase family 4 protein [Pseudomonadota bacterium]
MDDRYGRLFELPATLAQLGHEVHGISLSYRTRPEKCYQWDDINRLQWSSFNINPLSVWLYTKKVGEILKSFQPDIIWASSDVFHLLIGLITKKIAKRPLVIDLYDNYESFAMTRLPGMRSILRTACRKADGITVVSKSLDEHIKKTYLTKTPAIIIGNGVSPDVFFPSSRVLSRKLLNLPIDAYLIGTAGSLTKDRGIEDLFLAFERLATHNPKLWLVYAGRTDKIAKSFKNPRIINLGNLPHKKVSILFSALDVGVICNRESDFGSFCFPQKLYEMVACNLCFIAARTAGIADILSEHPDYLYTPGDDIQLAQRIQQHLPFPRPAPLKSMTWKQEAIRLEEWFQSVLSTPPPHPEREKNHAHSN